MGLVSTTILNLTNNHLNGVIRIPQNKKKSKLSISGKKITIPVFWNRKGIILVDFMLPGTTINAVAYCETLKRLRRRGMLILGVCLLYDNARPHTTRTTNALLERFNWDVLDQLPYSPDLTPSDFYLFVYEKWWEKFRR